VERMFGALLVGLAASPALAQDVLVVAPEEFREAASDWTRHREAQGRKVAFRAPGTDPAAVVRAVHKESGGALRFVLLLGDVDRVPCGYVPVDATAKWESDTRIATDAPFADPDADGTPDLAVGRVPAGSAAEARTLLARSLAYESDRDFSGWRRRMNVIAGTGGFGVLQDAAIEQMTKQFLTQHVPPGVVVTATYGNPISAWCPAPATFAETALSRFDEGSLVLAYVGHGSPGELDSVRFGKQTFPIFGPEQAARVDVRHGAPLAVFVACSTGKFDGERDCLAETLLRRPRGPVAVIASSRVSTPYSNGVLSKEMLEVLWRDRAPTAGEALLAIRRRLLSNDLDESRKRIEALAANFYDKDPARREADRREHVSLYNLLGDPCLRLGRPAELPLEAPDAAEAGGRVEVSGTSPFAGRAVIEVARRRDAMVPIGPRKTPEEWRAVYERANRQEVAQETVDVPAGAFRAAVTVPADAKPGAYCVRVFVEGKDGCALGGRDLEVRAAAPSPPAPPPPPPGDGR